MVVMVKEPYTFILIKRDCISVEDINDTVEAHIAKEYPNHPFVGGLDL